MVKMDHRHPDQKQFDVFAKDYDQRFIKNYPGAYLLFNMQLKEAAHLFASLKVFDLACGNGWTVEALSQYASGRYMGLDSSGPSLEILRSRMQNHQNLAVMTIEQSAEWILQDESKQQVKDFLQGSPNLVICNAAFHQIAKTFSGIDLLINQLHAVLKNAGVGLIGDYYYPATLPKRQIRASMDWIQQNTGQSPTSPEQWIPLEVLRGWLEKAGFQMQWFEEKQANDAIGLLFYIFRCQKV